MNFFDSLLFLILYIKRLKNVLADFILLDFDFFRIEKL